MNYKEVYGILKKSDYIDSLVDMSNDIEEPDILDKDYWFKVWKALYNKDTQFFDKVLKGQHGKGQWKRGNQQKDPVRALAVLIGRYPGTRRVLNYKKWKEGAQQAIKKSDEEALRQFANPLQYYVATSGKHLSYHSVPDHYYNRQKILQQDKVRNLYKNLITSDISQQLTEDTLDAKELLELYDYYDRQEQKQKQLRKKSPEKVSQFLRKQLEDPKIKRMWDKEKELWIRTGNSYD